MEVWGGGGGGGVAEGVGHYFCFAEEEAEWGVLVAGGGKENGNGDVCYRLSDNWVRTSLRYVFRMLLTLKT